MKILMQNRPDAFKIPGGDSIQMVKTKEFLEKLGIKIDINLGEEVDFKNYAIIHLFNITRINETYHYCIEAKKHKKPIALSTIYWNMDEFFLEFPSSKFYKYLPIFISKQILGKKTTLKLLSFMKKNLKIWKAQKFVLENCDLLLPNSQSEKEVLIKDFNLSPQKLFKIVPNAVDDNLFLSSKSNNFAKKYKVSNFVLCVGRIERRKNQLNLIKAMKNINASLVLVGGPNPYELDYFKKCRKLAQKSNKVVFIDNTPHNQLVPVYKEAQVHVLPSWYETPGLVSLEAALCGSNIVTTSRGSTKEYFKDMAWYCDPNNINSIKKAVQKALKAPKTDKLKKHILSHFTWEKAAQETLKAYKLILSS